MQISQAVGRLFTAACISLLCVSGQAQVQTSPKPPESQIGWLDHWRLSTFSLGQVQEQDGREFFKVIGTGVLVATDQRTAYIVTAKHVFDNPAKQWHPSEIRLRFAWQERKSVYDDLGTTLRLLDSSAKPRWLACEDGADIAAIPIALSELNASVQPHAISLSDIASTEDMFEGASILVLGYPGIIGTEYLVRAISRGGIVAWLNPEEPYGKPFLVDANIYPGNSGGPVIKLPTGTNKVGGFVVGGGTRLLGIVSQAPGLDQEVTLRVPGSLLPFRIKQTIPLGGTGVIEPAMKIPDLLKRFSVRQP